MAIDPKTYLSPNKIIEMTNGKFALIINLEGTFVAIQTAGNNDTMLCLTRPLSYWVNTLKYTRNSSDPNWSDIKTVYRSLTSNPALKNLNTLCRPANILWQMEEEIPEVPIDAALPDYGKYYTY